MNIISRVSFFLSLAAFFALTAPLSSHALLSPAPIATDSRIKTVLYGPNEVIKYTGYYKYASCILFGEGEQIGTISIGDAPAWQINPQGNRLYLRPIETDPTTNMMIITNKHVYYFELHGAEAKDVSDKNLTFELRIVYPGDEADGGNVVNNTLDQVPDLENGELNKYNFRYSISGSQEIAPTRIFDDGEFTYFQFNTINADIPAFFKVDHEGNESIINYRTRGPYIVVERVAPRYTLRHGKSVVCVFNEATEDGKPHSKKSSWYNFSGQSTRGDNVLPGAYDTSANSSPVQK